MALTPQQFKNLQVRRNDLRDTLNNINERMRDLQRQASVVRGQHEAVLLEIAKGTEGEILVTEHAMLRFMERVDMIDLEQLRTRIIPPDIEVRIKALGDGKYDTPTHRLVVKGNRVITVEVR